MVVALHLLCLRRQTLLIFKPALGHKFLGIWSPDRRGAVDTSNRNRNGSTTRNIDAVYHVARCGFYGGRKRDDVVLRSLKFFFFNKNMKSHEVKRYIQCGLFA